MKEDLIKKLLVFIELQEQSLEKLPGEYFQGQAQAYWNIKQLLQVNEE